MIIIRSLFITHEMKKNAPHYQPARTCGKKLMPILFRPHHFLCALCFQGKGYSPAFVKNFQAIMDKLNYRNGGATPINIVRETDSICAPCPHRQAALCASEANVQTLDRKHAAALKLSGTETLTWDEAKQRIKENISLNVFHETCSGCDWKASGICEQALTKFLSS